MQSLFSTQNPKSFLWSRISYLLNHLLKGVILPTFDEMTYHQFWYTICYPSKKHNLYLPLTDACLTVEETMNAALTTNDYHDSFLSDQTNSASLSLLFQDGDIYIYATTARISHLQWFCMSGKLSVEEKIIICVRLEKESTNKNKVDKTLCLFVSIIAWDFL